MTLKPETVYLDKPGHVEIHNFYTLSLWSSISKEHPHFRQEYKIYVFQTAGSLVFIIHYIVPPLAQSFQSKSEDAIGKPVTINT